MKHIVRIMAVTCLGGILGQGSMAWAESIHIELDSATRIYVDIHEDGETIHWKGEYDITVYSEDCDNPSISTGEEISSNGSSKAKEKGRYCLKLSNHEEPGWNVHVQRGMETQTNRVSSLAWKFHEDGHERINAKFYAKVTYAEESSASNTAWVELRFDGLNVSNSMITSDAIGVVQKKDGACPLYDPDTPIDSHRGSLPKNEACLAADLGVEQFPLYLEPPPHTNDDLAETPEIANFEFAPDFSVPTPEFCSKSGTFRFHSNVQGRYQLACDSDQDGRIDLDDDGDLLLGGTAELGMNEVPWDEEFDLAIYECRLHVFAGEVHLVAKDIEELDPGLRMFRYQASSNDSDTSLSMCWDDSKLSNQTTQSNDLLSDECKAPIPTDVNARSWDERGDNAYLDTYTWIYQTDTTIRIGDQDGDEAFDCDEIAWGLNPNDADSDDDGVPDGKEVDWDRDTDGDGRINALDPDSDGDGLFDGTEQGYNCESEFTNIRAGHCKPDADPSTRTDPLKVDSDGGGVRDGAEDPNHNGRIDPDEHGAPEHDPNDPVDDDSASQFDDSDDDKLSDAEERYAGTDPNDADSDDDGVRDGDEPDWNSDTDGDGLINARDPDSDNDGLRDGTELGYDAARIDANDTDTAAGFFVPDADPTTTTKPLVADTDGGGVRDGAEDPNHNGKIDSGEAGASERNPNDPADDGENGQPEDNDNDGLSNAEELHAGTDPADADTDDDGVLDGDEPNWNQDTDGDGMINALDPDSDDDELLDGTELGITIPASADTNMDSDNFRPDADPLTTTTAIAQDTDRGGVADGMEDTNRDGAVDGDETDPSYLVDDDKDRDGVANDRDNCPDQANADQFDWDDNGFGNACDGDFGVSGGGCTSAGTNSTGHALLVVLVFLGLGLRRRGRVAGPVVCCAAVALITAMLGQAQAQTLDTRDFSVERFRLAGDGKGLLDVEWGQVPGHLAWNLAVWLGTADDPLVMYKETEGMHDRVGALVSQRVAGNLGGGIALWDWLHVAVDVPLILRQRADDNLATSMATELSSFGLGDVRVTPKVQLLRAQRHGIHLALLPAITVPTGGGDHYRGESGLSLAPELALSRALGQWRLSANLGYRMRPNTAVVDLAVEDELFARLGAGYRFAAPTGRPIEIALTASAATAAGDPLGSFNQNHLETLAGVSYQVSAAMTAVAAGGVGLNEGFGTPDWRAMVGLRMSWERNRDDTALSDPSLAFDPIDDGDGAADTKQTDESAAPVSQNPIGENPIGQNPTGENPTGQNPTGEDPTGQNPERQRRRPIVTICEFVNPRQFQKQYRVYFDKVGEFGLDEEDRQTLLSAVQTLRSILDTYPEIEIVIEGHADNTGQLKRDIDDLSLNRAMAVEAFLAAHLPDAQFVTIGVGFTDSPTSNRYESGRQESRRVELRIRYQDDDMVKICDEHQ